MAGDAAPLLDEFVGAHSPRESGSEGERRAAEFIADRMRDMGYEPELQPVKAEFMSRRAAVALVAPDAVDLGSWPLHMSGLGEVAAQVVHAGNVGEGESLDGLRGKIALIERGGGVPFGEKARRAADAGAAAAVIYNNENGTFGGTLGAQGAIPVAAISRADGLDIAGKLDAGVPVEAVVRVVMERLDSQNVVAVKPGAGGADDADIVALGAHYDGVADTEGAGDNGTGVAALLTLARELAGRDLPFEVRFLFFGVEEIGLFGSRHYVASLSDAERGRHIAMLNFDAMGAGRASMLGSEGLLGDAEAYAAANGLPVQRHPGFSDIGSDHTPFIEAGIPALFFFGDDFSRINTTADTLDLVDPSIMGAHMALGMGLLDGFAAAAGR